MSNIITVKNLSKNYGSVQAIENSSFYVERGSLFALLGENGAGKSTTIDILSTLLAPDNGTIFIDGHSLGNHDEQIRQKTGIVFQNSLLDGALTVYENLIFRGKFYPLTSIALKTKIKQLAKELDLEDFLHRPYGKLSGGQRRRADIARALIHTPSILFLDEPTTGLDPASRKSIWKLVDHLQKNMGTTIFLTTHYMEEAAQADYVVVMGKGNILAKGSPSILKTNYSQDRFIFETCNAVAVEGILRELHATFEANHSRFTVMLSSTLDSIPLIECLTPYITSFEVIQGSLEDAFLTIINNQKAG